MGKRRKKELHVIAKQPGHAPELIVVKDDLDEYWALVGGYIECLPWDSNHLLVVNEEGLIKGLPFNFHYCGGSIVGPVFWVGVDGENFTDVDPDLLEEIEDFTGYHRYDLDADTADLEDLIQTALGGEPIPLGGGESEQDND